jgi:hypothetical protein
MASMHGYLANVQAALHFDVTGVAEKEREHDKYIMDCLIESRQFSSNEINKLIHCRLYFGAILLSDLATTTGDRLDAGKH